MPLGSGPPSGNGPLGPAGPPGGPMSMSGPPPHGVHPGQGMPGHMPPLHGMMPGQGAPQYHAGGAGGPQPGGGAAGAPPAAALHPPGAGTPPHGQAPPPTSSSNGPPSASSPMAGSLPAPGPDNIIALQRAIDSMEEKGLQEDPRYSQLLALRARSGAGPAHDPARGMFSNIQLSQLKAQITAYRSLARNQPLSQQILMMAAGKRGDGAPPECPAPPGQPPYGEAQGPAATSGAGKPGGAGAAGEPARGGGGAPPTPLPMTGQMAPPTQLTPPLVNPVINFDFYLSLHERH